MGGRGKRKAMGRLVGKSDWKIKKPDWVSDEELSSTDLYRRACMRVTRKTERPHPASTNKLISGKGNFPERKKNAPEDMSIAALHELGPPEEFGLPITAHRLVEVVVENAFLIDRRMATERVVKVMKGVRQVLSERKRQGHPLHREVIVSCLVDCVKSASPLSRKEIEARREFRESGYYKATTKDRLTRFREELLSILMYPDGKCASDQKGLMSTMEASEWIGDWLVDLCVPLGEKMDEVQKAKRPSRARKKGAISQGRVHYKSEARHNAKVAAAADSIRRAANRKKRRKK